MLSEFVITLRPLTNLHTLHLTMHDISSVERILQTLELARTEGGQVRVNTLRKVRISASPMPVLADYARQLERHKMELEDMVLGILGSGVGDDGEKMRVEVTVKVEAVGLSNFWR